MLEIKGATKLFGNVFQVHVFAKNLRDACLIHNLDLRSRDWINPSFDNLPYLVEVPGGSNDLS